MKSVKACNGVEKLSESTNFSHVETILGSALNFVDVP